MKSQMITRLCESFLRSCWTARMIPISASVASVSARWGHRSFSEKLMSTTEPPSHCRLSIGGVFLGHILSCGIMS